MALFQASNGAEATAKGKSFSFGNQYYPLICSCYLTNDAKTLIAESIYLDKPIGKGKGSSVTASDIGVVEVRGSNGTTDRFTSPSTQLNFTFLVNGSNSVYLASMTKKDGTAFSFTTNTAANLAIYGITLTIPS